jgi:hypothetical protein
MGKIAMNLAPDLDIFSLGRDAVAKARALFDGRACFVSARRLRADGSWSGPPEASCCLVDEEVLQARGGLGFAREAGANTVSCNLDSAVAGEAFALGLRVLVRVPFAADEPADQRRGHLEKLADVQRRTPGIDGVMPLPVGEAQGLDTLAFFAACRAACARAHVVVDLESFGHKLGQLCLSFGADEILGSIVGQRALRLGERASSNEITRDEATLLVRASGLVPCERLPDGKVLPL